MKINILFCLVCLSSAALAQPDTSKKTITISSDEFTMLEKEATFPGGLQGWAKYLQANLNADLGEKYIPLPKGQKLARQTVKVQFRVNKDGGISDAKVINPTEVHKKLGEEAIRVITHGPKWVPARQNGRNVIYQAVQSITFQVTKD
jgi:periplasmic protein TonB